jgi:anti-sigma regulatory factor (Ser/Thr protein kinase)
MLDDGAAGAPDHGWERSTRPEDLMVVVESVPAAVPAARREVRRWLDALEWPVQDAEDVELAVNEAIANVVDHAYPPGAPGTATVHAWVSTDPRARGRRIGVAVTDRGRWAAHHPDGPAPHARGHGLAVMSGCMAELHIQRSVAGTTVVMVSAPVPS